MEHLIICMLIWALVMVTIPLQRMIKLRSVIFISILWMVVLDNLSARLGYYSYEQSLLSIGRAPVFQLLVYPGVGLLMTNWLTEKPMSKLYAIITVACTFSVTQFFYLKKGAFQFGSFDAVLCFIYNIAALSVFIWLTLAVTGEQIIYNGKKTREIIKAPDPNRV
jgi:hypothetical protein